MGKTLPSGMQAFYTVAPSHIAIFATVLAVGLVVLQALFAGASAAAYEELADAAAYETAQEAAPAAAFHEPAMAFADAGPRGFADARPTDHRIAEQREDLASAAAAEAAMPPMMETQPQVHTTPSDETDLRMQAAVVHEEVPSQPEEHAPEPAIADEHAAPAPREFQATAEHADTVVHAVAPEEHGEDSTGHHRPGSRGAASRSGGRHGCSTPRRIHAAGVNYSAALALFAGAIFSGARPLSSGLRYCPV
jgi:hypothetical protein